MGNPEPARRPHPSPGRGPRVSNAQKAVKNLTPPALVAPAALWTGAEPEFREACAGNNILRGHQVPLSLHIRGVLQSQSRGFVTILLLLFGSAAPQPARAANTPISSVSGRGPTLSATQVTRGPTGSLAWRQFQCRSCSFQQWSPCV